MDGMNEKWEEIVSKISKQFAEGEDVDLDGIIFLIGVQELGQGFRKFKKDEKLNVMHIAICRLLEPYGYYEFEAYDEDGWPHYRKIEDLPHLKPGHQTRLMKEAVIQYFEESGFLA
ncbi:MAG: hypothetical protein HWD92_01520 [Flavobacteriia bacterium]|nr:hypothetical protein [Flavobacteriia bacterium]